MDKYTHIVGMSGGKDSTALALRLSEVHPEIDFQYVITPTGDELDEMFDHWKYVESLIGKKFTVLSCGYSLSGLVRKMNMIPNHRARWCTRVLKIEPFQRYAIEHAPAKVYIGLRADEPSEVRGGAIYGEMSGVEQVYPLREWGWGVNDVWKYLQDKGVTIPDRTDCARCFHQRLGEWWNLWKFNRSHYDSAVSEEIEHGHTYRSEQRDTWPASLLELGKEFEKGNVPKGAKCQGEFDFDTMETRPTQCRACSL